jgi:glutamyl-tRNA synthetase
MNGEYIRLLSVDAFIDRAMPVIVAEPWADRVSRAQLETIAEMVQPRLRSLNDLPSQVDFLFLAAAPVDEKSWEKVMVASEDAHDILGEAAAAFAICEWNRDALHAALLAIGEGRGKKLGKVQAPVRVAVTGRTVGPPLFESLELLGREETLARIATARAKVTG